jgi:DNA-binding transcriptional regulator YiaG
MPHAMTPEERRAAKVAWAAFIDRLLEVSRWEARELAEALGVSEATVSRWRDLDLERGRIPSGPAARMLESMARKLGMVK